MKMIKAKAVETAEAIFPFGERKPLPKGKVTFEEFLEWSDEDSFAEWVDGEIVLMSPVSRIHQEITGFLSTLLRLYTQINQLGAIFEDPFLMRLPLSGREPDVIFIKTEHLSQLTDTYLDGPADVAVEVVSKESIDRDYVIKFAEYVQAGVLEYWLIDPLEEKAIFYHRTEAGGYQPMPLDERGIFRSQEIVGFWLKVEWLWQKPLPELLSTLQELIPEMQTEALRREIEGRRQAEERAQTAEERAQHAEAEQDRLRSELEALRNPK